MYSYTIDAMAKMIAEKLSTAYEGFSGDKRMCSDLQEYIRATLSEFWEGKIALIWEIEDVFTEAENMGVKLTKEQAIEVLQAVLDHHDATMGVSWTTLDCAIEDLLRENKKHDRFCAAITNDLFPEYDQD